RCHHRKRNDPPSQRGRDCAAARVDGADGAHRLDRDRPSSHAGSVLDVQRNRARAVVAPLHPTRWHDLDSPRISRGGLAAGVRGGEYRNRRSGNSHPPAGAAGRQPAKVMSNDYSIYSSVSACVLDVLSNQSFPWSLFRPMNNVIGQNPKAMEPFITLSSATHAVISRP